jgi:hypothetical protein
MPYLRFTCPSLPAVRRRQIAGELTDLLVDLYDRERRRAVRAPRGTASISALRSM